MRINNYIEGTLDEIENGFYDFSDKEKIKKYLESKMYKAWTIGVEEGIKELEDEVGMNVEDIIVGLRKTEGMGTKIAREGHGGYTGVARDLMC